MKLGVVLLHHPMVNRHGERVTTAVTNMDLHDLSRTSTTYGAKDLFVVTPIEHQHALMKRILDHWLKPQSKEVHPDRVEALSRVRLAYDFDEVLARFDDGNRPKVVMTDASELDVSKTKRIGYGPLKVEIAKHPTLLVFGTGWGIAPEFYEKVDWFLDPIYGPGGSNGYNHLSVRAAVAAVLDRLMGQ